MYGRYVILLLVIVFRTQKPFGYAAIIRQDDKSRRVLVEPAYREDATDRYTLCDVFFRALGRVRDDAAGFVVCKVSVCFCGTTHLHAVLQRDFLPEDSSFAIDRYESVLDQRIGLAASSIAPLGKIFVESFRNIAHTVE